MGSTEIRIHREMESNNSDVDQVDGNGRTSLHTAAERGNLEVVRNKLSIRPKLATKVDYKGISPLHLASANGHLEVVEHLINLNLNQSTCLLRDNKGNTPLHMAARRGQIGVVRHLLDVNQSIVFLEDLKGNKPLHVAANFDQIEVAKLLISRLQQQPVQGVIQQPVQGVIKHTAKLQKCVIVLGPEALKQIIKADPNFLNGCDNEEENTLLHTATLHNNLEMVTFLVDRDDILMAKNKKGFTALDITERSSENNKPIWDLLKRRSNKWEHMSGNFFENKRNAILVAASINASMAFGAGLNPPGGFWQEDKQSFGDNHNASIGTSIMASTKPSLYTVFLRLTTLAFVLSMCIILLLISEIRLSRIIFICLNPNIFMHILTVGMWFAITLIGCTYFLGLQAMIPTTVNKNVVIFMSIISMFVWVVLTGIILLDRTNICTCFLTKNRDLSDRATNQHNANNAVQHATNQHNANNAVQHAANQHNANNAVQHATNHHNANNAVQHDGGDQNNISVEVRNYNDDEDRPNAHGCTRRFAGTSLGQFDA